MNIRLPIFAALVLLAGCANTTAPPLDATGTVACVAVSSFTLQTTTVYIHADKPGRELPHGDFEVRPTTPWNYGLALDPARPADGLRFEERPIGERPFSPLGAGMVAFARARRIPSWKLAHGWAAEISPATAKR